LILTPGQRSYEGKLVPVFKGGFSGGADAVDLDKSYFPVLKAQALDDLRNGTALGDVEGDWFYPFFQAF